MEREASAISWQAWVECQLNNSISTNSILSCEEKQARGLKSWNESQRENPNKSYVINELCKFK